jgi:hypothetical protein
MVIAGRWRLPPAPSYHPHQLTGKPKRKVRAGKRVGRVCGMRVSPVIFTDAWASRPCHNDSSAPRYSAEGAHGFSAESGLTTNRPNRVYARASSWADRSRGKTPRLLRRSQTPPGPVSRPVDSPLPVLARSFTNFKPANRLSSATFESLHIRP